tara:strand:+ start:696 stop:944 length:249 start_codon:yes stop_codon:yes gene_type:complete
VSFATLVQVLDTSIFSLKSFVPPVWSGLLKDDKSIVNPQISKVLPDFSHQLKLFSNSLNSQFSNSSNSILSSHKSISPHTNT